jgi:hypothetical protein
LRMIPTTFAYNGAYGIRRCADSQVRHGWLVAIEMVAPQV